MAIVYPQIQTSVTGVKHGELRGAVRLSGPKALPELHLRRGYLNQVGIPTQQVTAERGEVFQYGTEGGCQLLHGAYLLGLNSSLAGGAGFRELKEGRQTLECVAAGLTTLGGTWAGVSCLC